MSNQNENLELKQKNDFIAINEDGELVVKDDKLKEALQELTSEELEGIAGGIKGDNGNCRCKPKEKA
ncbi:hypothetical protein NIES4071_24350 [Calothrix sp. NIES-4071]|nr:hypothetical protein NIES4071_24350 [Calothrix sp. NIES-4071]BAZ56758.1 hypothetical protein NIES4105_24290 [Calothrix sp. NIES-4105]